jgi:inosose dehydratase
VASAPITWGVCEVPGWGHQMEPDRVLHEMARLGFQATELGPRGFLPEDGPRLTALLARHRLSLVGGFVPAPLHLRNTLHRELEAVDAAARTLAEGGAELMVLAATTGTVSYEAGGALDEAAWSTLLGALEQAEAIADRHGLLLALHPHYGTVIETAGDVERLLETSKVGLCVDMGHLTVGGADPVDVIRKADDRVRHVHLKDVDADLAARVRSRAIGYRDAVAAGLYRPLGAGGARIGEAVQTLERQGYPGWYVLEQDTVLEADPPPGRGPIEAAAASLAFLKGVAA